MESMWCLFLILKNHMTPLGKVEILASFMKTIVSGKDATVNDSMFTAKINCSPCFKLQKLTFKSLRSTSLLLLS